MPNLLHVHNSYILKILINIINVRNYSYLGLLRFFLTVGSGLSGQIVNFPLKCSMTSWQGGFVIAEKFSVLQCLSRRFLNELTLGAVTTSSVKSFHNFVTLSEKLSFLKFI